MARTASAHAERGFFRRSIVAWKFRAPGQQDRVVDVRWSGKRIVPWSGPVRPGEEIVEARLSCGHWYRFARPRPASATPNSAPCSPCGSGRRKNRPGKYHDGVRQADADEGFTVEPPSPRELRARRERIEEVLVSSANDPEVRQVAVFLIEAAIEARTIKPLTAYAEQCFERIDVTARRLSILPSFDPREDVDG